MRRGHLPKDLAPSDGYSRSFSSTHALPFQRAEGNSSNSINSSCHCCSKGLGASTNIGPPSGSSSAISMAAIASCTVLPKPTWSASTSLAPPRRCRSSASRAKYFWCGHRPCSRRYTGVSTAAAAATSVGSAIVVKSAGSMTVREMMRCTSCTMNGQQAKSTARASFHSASNSSCTQAMVSGSLSSHSSS